VAEGLVEDASPEIERRTITSAEQSQALSKQSIEFSGERNVLNNYRSFTYNFTLAALRKSLVNDPDKIREGFDLVILRSGGKGTGGLVKPAAGVERVDRKSQEINSSNRSTSAGDSLVSGFDQSSPGRFDMFIDDVEIETLMTFSQNSNVTLPTKIRFEVIEPYSVNGFIEALHVSAVAAGYPSYLQASFVLVLEFVGYPDSADFTEPEIVPNSVRYFPMGFTGIEVDITERGTRYRCTAVPFNERAFGQPNSIQKSLSAQGLTVEDIIKDLLEGVQRQLKLSDDAGKRKPGAQDIYQVKFPAWSESQGFDFAQKNKIASSKFLTISRDSALFKPNSPDQGKIESKSITLPKKDNLTTVQFGDNMNLHESIISIVRDSEYVRLLVEKLAEGSGAGLIDDYGFVDYFSVRMEVANKEEIDEVTKKPVQEFTYVVAPYKVHYTKIPGLGSVLRDTEKLKRRALREYNYIYTGDNVDVIDFKLQFNTLFFEAVPTGMANIDVKESKDLSSRSGNSDLKVGSNGIEQTSSVPDQVTKPDAAATSLKYGNGPTAGQPLTTYGAFAKSMHEAITDSKASMITGEISILGDPFYLVTGGMGGYNPKPDARRPGQGGQGEALFNYGEVLININFQNPIDINETNGFLTFDPERVPFSGVYQVTRAVNNFKNGDFRQRLDIIRTPGQILRKEVPSQDLSSIYQAVPNPEKTKVDDSTRAPSRPIPASMAASVINRGMPNSIDPVGGLGGASLLNQVSSFGANALSAGSSIIGKALPTDIVSNLRLNTAGLADFAKSSLGSSAVISAAANIITGNLPAERAAGLLASTLVSNTINSISSKTGMGSGIGEGATKSIINDTVSSVNATMNDIRSGLTIDPVKLSSDAINNVKGIVTDLGTNAISAAKDLGKSASGLIGDVENKVSSLLQSTADPNAIAAKVGIDASAISGLSSNLQSKVVGQIAEFSKKIPQNLNLGQALDAGLALDYISPANLKNVPPFAPKVTAPDPEPDLKYLQEVVQGGGTRALENLYGVNSIKKLSSSIVPQELISAASNFQRTGISGALSNFNAVDTTVLTDKLSSVQKQVSNLTGQISVIDSGLATSVSSKFGSVVEASPLTQLINRLNG
jgi:hypothetical protein